MASLYTVQSFAAGNGDRYVGAPFATRAPAIAQHGMAATMQKKITVQKPLRMT